MMYRQPKNQAGVMGAKSAQPAKAMSAMTVDPIERLNQKMAGRTEGGNKPKKRRSMMNSYRMM